MVVSTVSSGSLLDVWLDEICRDIQLTKSQYGDAVEKYEAVANWLTRDGSTFADIRLRVFPQGSVAYGTTVKPRGRDEYDVDLVLLLHVSTDDAMAVYKAVRDRLYEHDIYAELTEEMNRCLRLNYAGRFHLDILPAKPQQGGDGSWIMVPDKDLDDWSPSNPEGFRDWFLEIARAVYVRAERGTEPLPAPEDADAKAPLQRAVQLLKRRRDIYFERNGDGDDAPRSIVLTTLAARHYRGEHAVAAALKSIVEGMKREISTCPGILEVPNPTRDEENFAEAWDLQSYRRFVAFVEALHADLSELDALEGEAVGERLEEMFGENVTRRALKAAGHRFRQARVDGTARVTTSGIAIGATATSRSQPLRDHNFYGDGP